MTNGKPVEPTPYVVRSNRPAGATGGVPSDVSDFRNASQGLIARPDVPRIPARDGKTVAWDFGRFDFLRDEEEIPPSVNARVWRQGRMNAMAGLYLVTRAEDGGVYQVRGYDLANMTIVEGRTGLIVIDPLGSYETAQYALRLYRATTDDQRPVKAIVYTASCVDHFGGSRGLFADPADQADQAAGQQAGHEDTVPDDLAVYAPDGFLDDAVRRHVVEGLATACLVDHTYGTRLEAGPYGLIDSGPGLTVSAGEATLVPPTHQLSGEVEADGVRLVLQPAAGLQSPAEMNVYLPDRKLLYLTAPGLLGGLGDVRARHLDETLKAFGGVAEIVAGAYEWPGWGDKAVSARLAARRDAWVRRQTQPSNQPFHAAGYVGTATQAARQTWLRLLGHECVAATDAVAPTPASATTAKRYVVALGGAEAVLTAAREEYDAETPRYERVVELLDHVVAAACDPTTVSPTVLEAATSLQALALTQLGYLAEYGPLRNVYLTAARDLRSVPQPPGARPVVGDLVRYANPAQYFAAVAARLDGPRAAELRDPVVLLWHFTNTGQSGVTVLRDGVLVYTDTRGDTMPPGVDKPQATITLTRETLDQLLAPGPDFAANFDAAVRAGRVQIDDRGPADAVFGYLLPTIAAVN
ncbi:alkyl sulfatase dimerization domain-containing protein [Streptomyces sp. NPDC058301]|uniref:alkyl sulfatase dimerization domain-containing protein n=1 Tax=Streptomyces sp. NPDC058301 TaxID=3346436 RepID=UPI0036E4FA11